MNDKIRIYHNPDSEYFEFHVILIDDEEFLKYQKYLFGILVEEDVIKIDWLKERNPDYLKMDFEDYKSYIPNLFESEEGFEKSKNLILEKLNERFNASWINKMTFFEKISSELKNNEIKEGYFFNFEMGLFIKDKWDGYNTKRVDYQFENIITIYLYGSGDINNVGLKYQKFQNWFDVNKIKFYSTLQKRYEDVKEGTELSHLTKKEMKRLYPKITNPKQLKGLIKPTHLGININDTDEYQYSIKGDCTWDGEHGFDIAIKRDWSMEIN